MHILLNVHITVNYRHTLIIVYNVYVYTECQLGISSKFDFNNKNNILNHLGCECPKLLLNNV